MVIETSESRGYTILRYYREPKVLRVFICIMSKGDCMKQIIYKPSERMKVVLK